MIYRNYNFTETVKKALNIAERITVKAENSSIDTPYVVYGLLSVDCVSKTTLNSFGIYSQFYFDFRQNGEAVTRFFAAYNLGVRPVESSCQAGGQQLYRCRAYSACCSFVR